MYLAGARFRNEDNANRTQVLINEARQPLSGLLASSLWTRGYTMNGRPEFEYSTFTVGMGDGSCANSTALAAASEPSAESRIFTHVFFSHCAVLMSLSRQVHPCIAPGSWNNV